MNIIVNKIIKYSFQEPSFCYIDTREGWNQLRKIAVERGTWGKARRQDGQKGEGPGERGGAMLRHEERGR